MNAEVRAIRARPGDVQVVPAYRLERRLVEHVQFRASDRQAIDLNTGRGMTVEYQGRAWAGVAESNRVGNLRQLMQAGDRIVNAYSGAIVAR
jgi:hypothetical protein